MTVCSQAERDVVKTRAVEGGQGNLVTALTVLQATGLERQSLCLKETESTSWLTSAWSLGVAAPTLTG